MWEQGRTRSSSISLSDFARHTLAAACRSHTLSLPAVSLSDGDACRAEKKPPVRENDCVNRLPWASVARPFGSGTEPPPVAGAEGRTVDSRGVHSDQPHSGNTGRRPTSMTRPLLERRQRATWSPQNSPPTAPATMQTPSSTSPVAISGSEDSTALTPILAGSGALLFFVIATVVAWRVRRRRSGGPISVREGPTGGVRAVAGGRALKGEHDTGLPPLPRSQARDLPHLCCPLPSASAARR